LWGRIPIDLGSNSAPALEIAGRQAAGNGQIGNREFVGIGLSQRLA
jgi:hypothetical protein